jgi:hypothetical protein
MIKEGKMHKKAQTSSDWDNVFVKITDTYIITS